MPKFFSPHEEKLFRKYLIKVGVNYYLFFNREEKLVACGGYEYEATLNKIALTWGMVDQQFHNQNYGRSMTEYRLKKIKQAFPRTNITLNTSQHTFKFYEKFGFSVNKITKNGYCQGLDKYDMIKITN